LGIDRPAADRQAHDLVEGQAGGVVDIPVSGQSPEHRLPEQPVRTVAAFLPQPVFRSAAGARSHSPRGVIALAHHRQTTV
jgi:hypothetical protein